jgi:hypothetical protein
VASKKPNAVQPPVTTSAASPAAAPASPPPSPPNQSSLITATANGSNHGTKVDLQAVYQAVVNGLLTFYSPTDIFQMAAGTYTRDELVGEFQTFVEAAQTTKANNQQWRAAIQTERTLELHVRELRSGVRGITQARFGKAGAQNLQFGFTLPTPVKKSAETKAVAVAKSKATRAKRNTLGSVQKKDIKGNVNVALVVTPGTDGSQATPPNAAQPAAPSAPTPEAPTAVPTPTNAATAAPAPTATPSAGAVPPGPVVAGH